MSEPCAHKVGATSTRNKMELDETVHEPSSFEGLGIGFDLGGGPIRIRLQQKNQPLLSSEILGGAIEISPPEDRGI